MFLIPYNSFTDILDVETHGVLPMMLVSASVLFVVTQRSARPRSAGPVGDGCRDCLPLSSQVMSALHVKRHHLPFSLCLVGDDSS